MNDTLMRAMFDHICHHSGSLVRTPVTELVQIVRMCAEVAQRYGRHVDVEDAVAQAMSPDRRRLEDEAKARVLRYMQETDFYGVLVATIMSLNTQNKDHSLANKLEALIEMSIRAVTRPESFGD